MCAQSLCLATYQRDKVVSWTSILFYVSSRLVTPESTPLLTLSTVTLLQKPRRPPSYEISSVNGMTFYVLGLFLILRATPVVVCLRDSHPLASDWCDVPMLQGTEDGSRGIARVFIGVLVRVLVGFLVGVFITPSMRIFINYYYDIHELLIKILIRY